MGSKDMRDAFNQVAQPKFSCSIAMQNYEREGAVEWQVLTFRGRDAAGAEFEVKSDRHSPNDDPNVVAAEVATKLLAEAEKTP